MPKEMPPDQREVVGTWIEGDTECTLVRTTMHHEAFTFTANDGRWITFDITVAKQLVERGEILARVPIEPEQLKHIALNNDWDESVARGADPSVPGIAAPMSWNGETIYVLIDGTHRAVKALLTGVTFEASVLNEAAARLCYVKGSRDLLP